MSLNSLYSWSRDLPETDELMPAVFAGHGSPMNAILENEFTRSWNQIGKDLPLPKAVLIISAHWLTTGTYVTAMETPRTIHDFGGFPDELFRVQYPAPGQPALAAYTADIVKGPEVIQDHDWGFDHGTWSVLKHIYPNAEIPIVQFSIDYSQPASYHFQLGRQLKSLRKKGVLIMGSGNMVHNLRMVAWDKLDEPGFGFDWAHEMNDVFKSRILSADDLSLVNWEGLGAAARLAIPTPDHYYPLIYAMSVRDPKDDIRFFNDALVGGSLNMTSVVWG